MMPKALIAMSGGVDSSVSAFMLQNMGYEVVGVTFLFYQSQTSQQEESIQRAAITSSLLGFEHHVVDLREAFKKTIIEPFFDAYLSGVTPNPCVWCNPLMKFASLISEADRIGAEYVSTGHYAIIDKALLKKGIDPKKDQSYALYRLSVEQIKRIVLPLGMCLKDEIKKSALQMNLPAAGVSESQDICFMEGKGYYSYIKKTPEGLIIDINTGRRLGTHRGFHNFTIGQRKRLGVASPLPLYVVDIDAAANTVYVGNASQAMSQRIRVSDINWIILKDRDFDATVKIRSTMRDEPARITLINETEAFIDFQTPQWAPAVGQSAVFYEGSMVIGGGIIVK